MKTGKALPVLAAVMVAFVWSASHAPGQGFDLGTGGKPVGPRGGDLGGGVGIEYGKPQFPTKAKTITIKEIIVSREREWTNNEGKKIKAALVAFRKAPDAAKDAPIEILKEGKVRLMLNEDLQNIVPYPLEKLSEADQEFVSNLALNFRLSADAAREKAEAEAEKKAAEAEAAPAPSAG